MNNFAVFILTHGRPNNQLTYKSLRKAGYTGKIYFVIDDLDETSDEYIKNFGKENVIIFDKREIAKNTDRFLNYEKLDGVVYARNVCFEIAKKLDLEYFLNCDDDIRNFHYRLIENNKMGSVPLISFDDVFEVILEFMKTSDIELFSISENGIYFGGINERTKGINMTFGHFFIFNTKSKIRFRSFWLEDLITNIDILKRGHRVISSSFISQTLIGRGDGGMADSYNETNDNCIVFNILLCHPDVIKLYFKIKKDKILYSHKTNWKNVCVKTISDRYKKGQKDV